MADLQQSLINQFQPPSFTVEDLMRLLTGRDQRVSSERFREPEQGGFDLGQSLADALFGGQGGPRSLTSGQQPASGGTGSAVTGANIGGLIGGVPGRAIGAGIGTIEDVRNFASMLGAPGFTDPSGFQHGLSAFSGGLTGQSLVDQAIAAAAKINPAMNPADVFSATTIGIRDTGGARTPGGPVGRALARTGNLAARASAGGGPGAGGRTAGGAAGRAAARERGMSGRAG